VFSTHALYASRDERTRLGLDEELFRPSDHESSLPAAARDPLLMTAMVLAGANSDSTAFLTGGTIAALYLPRLRMVVLSTCESAAGQPTTNEGVFSLQRAFHQAGVPTVIGSLWKARDDIGFKIVAHYHRNLRDEGLPPPEALRQAQRAHLRNAGGIEALPYYWANWSASGQPGDLARLGASAEESYNTGAGLAESSNEIGTRPEGGSGAAYLVFTTIGAGGLVLLGVVAWRRHWVRGAGSSHSGLPDRE
jgi:hypothetical protein